MTLIAGFVGSVFALGLSLYGLRGLLATPRLIAENRRPIELEIEFMRHFHCEGEPEYMRAFRVTRSEHDLRTVAWLMWVGAAILYGVPLIAGIILFALVFLGPSVVC